MVRSLFTEYSDITKDLLDSIEVGDLIVVNDWENPFVVRGVSENYFVMVDTVSHGGNRCYSVCEKKPWSGIRHNEMHSGMFHVGTDAWVFGAPIEDYKAGHIYSFVDSGITKQYLDLFESGESELSPRNAVPIYSLMIWKTDEMFGLLSPAYQERIVKSIDRIADDSNDLALYWVEADYRLRNDKKPIYYYIGTSERSVRRRFFSKMSILKIYGIGKVESFEDVVDILMRPYQHIVFY